MLYKIREALARFMTGRNGADELSRATMWLCLIGLAISLISRWNIIYWISLALLIYMYFRMFSRNIPRRRRENEWFLQKKYGYYAWIDKKKRRGAQKKTHRFYRCNGCGQTIRVPKGKGRIEITCPKCHYKFIKKT